jgi:hypothetical protein
MNTPKQRALDMLFGRKFELPSGSDNDLRVYIHLETAEPVSINDVIKAYEAEDAAQ